MCVFFRCHDNHWDWSDLNDSLWQDVPLTAPFKRVLNVRPLFHFNVQQSLVEPSGKRNCTDSIVVLWHRGLHFSRYLLWTLLFCPDTEPQRWCVGVCGVFWQFNEDLRGLRWSVTQSVLKWMYGMWVKIKNRYGGGTTWEVFLLNSFRLLRRTQTGLVLGVVLG